MSLEQSLGELSQKVHQQEKTKEEKDLSGIRKNITYLEKDKKGLEGASFAVDESYGLVGEQLAHFKETKKIINNLFEKHKDDLEKAKGIKTKWELANTPKFKKEPEIKAFKGSSKDLRETMRKVIEAKENLGGKGIDKTARKFFPGEVKKKSGELDKKIKELKLQTPEGQEERKQEIKDKIRKEAWNLHFSEGVDKAVLVTDKYFQESRNIGEGGEKIVKEAIAEAFQEKNEKIKSLKEINQELSLLNDFKGIINSYPSLSSKIEKIKDLTEEDLPKILEKELKINEKLRNDCGDFFRTNNVSTILRNSFFENNLAESVKDWFYNAKRLCQKGEDLIKSDYSHLEDGMSNIAILNEDTEKMFGLFSDLGKNLSKELSLYMKNSLEYLKESGQGNHRGETDISLKLKEFFGKKEADYNFKPKEETKNLIRQKGVEEAKKETEEKLKRIEDQLQVKIDLDWLKVKENNFKEENSIWSIEQKQNVIEEEKRKAKEALVGLDDIQTKIKDSLDKKISILKTQGESIPNNEGGFSKRYFDKLCSLEFERSFGMKIELEGKEAQLKGIQKQLDDKKEEGFDPLGLRAKRNKPIIANLNERVKVLGGEIKELGKIYQEQAEKEFQLKRINILIEDFEFSKNLGKEFPEKEISLKDAIEIIKNKLREIGEKQLSKEEQGILQTDQDFNLKVKEAEEHFNKIKK